MSDKYYRGLRNSIDDVKYKLQLASMNLKINENKNNINGIKNDISGINNFSDKINDNETNISNNLTKINDIDDDIDEIKSNLNNIKKVLSDFKINYSIQNLYIYNINKTKNLIKQKFNNLWLQLAFFNKHYQTKFIKQLLNFWALHINIFSDFM